MIPKLICLTPVKNEAWILDTFLKSASIWADYIIIADQNSTDGSREIISHYPKAIVIENNSSIPNEPERQQMLLNAARNIPGPKILMAIDADEILSPEALTPDTWKTIFSQPVGTILKFQWATLFPNSNNFWTGYHLPYGYIDDGIQHTNTNFFHGTRLPTPEGHPIYDVTEFKVIHFQYMNPERNVRRQRWYQCLELDNPSIAKDAIEIYRKYHYEQMHTADRLSVIPQKWIEQYNEKGIDILKTYFEDNYWYDDEVKTLFDKYGIKHFKKLDIWRDEFKDKDPRDIIDKAVHLWLRKTQPHYFTKVRKIDNIIRRILNY
ncbi:MAG: glycosyltransferase family 2 protein [Bacteroidales bacterium]|nr:glycosyltransferase family 2 protein [Bacteroidales bacterium]